jgi:HK97 family phage portal protein
MDLFGRFRRKAKTIAPAVSPDTAGAAAGRRADTMGEIVAALAGGSMSASGIRVTPESALTFSAVLACVRVLGESVAGLPLITYRRLPDGSKERADDHPLYAVLHDAPNDEMTSFQWRETSMMHKLLWGNAYSEIITDGAGRVRELWPLLPQSMTPKRDRGNELIYEYRDPLGTPITYSKEQIYHVPGLSMNGLVGMTMIGIFRESVGLGMVLNRHGSRVFENGARAGGVLESPGQMSEPAYNRLKSSFNAEYVGVENAGKTILLEEGTKFNPLTMPNDDAQFLESRRFQVEEVARIFRVPLSFIGDLSHATFSNIEQLSLDFVVHTLRPWLVRDEQAIRQRLLLPSERGQYYAEYLVDGLLRGDIVSRYNAYATGRNWGWLSADDVRALENMNPLPGGQGKTYLTPLNMNPAGTAAPVGTGAT